MPTSDLVRFKQKFGRKMRVTVVTAKLGDRDGDGQVVYVPGRPGWAYVREPQAGGWGPPVPRRISGVINPTADRYVILGYDESGELVIQARDIRSMAASGGQPVKQPGDPQTADSAWLFQDKFVTLLSFSYTTTLGGPSTDIGVRAWLYIRSGTLTYFPGERIDAASFIPAAGAHRVVCVFLKTDNTLELVGSTAKSIVDPLTYSADIQECLDNATAGSLPVWAWILKDDQSAITDADKWLDLRNLVNDPLGVGGSFAPDDSEYIIRVADADLPNAQVLGALSSGFMKVAATTGVVSSVADPLPIANGGTNKTSYTGGALVKKHLTNPTLDPFTGSAVGDVPLWDGNEWIVGTDVIANGEVSGSALATLTITPLGSALGSNIVELVLLCRSTVAAAGDTVRVYLNNDTTAANYAAQYVSGSGFTAAADQNSGAVASVCNAFVSGSTVAANWWSLLRVRIPIFNEATKYKVCHWSNDVFFTSGYTVLYGSGVWLSTAAITRIDVIVAGGSLAIGTRYWLKGIR